MSTTASTPIRYLNPEARYSDAAIYGPTVYLAGQVPADPSADMAGQTLSVLTQIDALLNEAGSDLAQQNTQMMQEIKRTIV